MVFLVSDALLWIIREDIGIYFYVGLILILWIFFFAVWSGFPFLLSAPVPSKIIIVNDLKSAFEKVEEENKL
jgi:hypothetical protein